MILSVDTKNAKFSTVVVGAQTIPLVMKPGKIYEFATNTNCYIKQDASGNNPAASAGDGSTLVPAGSTRVIHGSFGDTLSVIRDTADGKATLTPIVDVR
jgi:hypothetical protein